MNACNINRTLVAVLGIVTACTFVSAAPTTQTVEVQDVSEVGSPLNITGTVEINEDVGVDTLTYSFRDSISAKNVSQKTILTIVLSLEVYYPHGQIDRDVKQYECFFAPDVILPGQTEPIVPREGTTTTPLRSSRSPISPRAEMRVLYVQFLDGSNTARSVMQRIFFASVITPWLF